MADEIEETGGGGAPGGGGALKKYGPLAAIVLVAQLIITYALIQTWPSAAERDTGEDLIPDTEVRLDGKDAEFAELPFTWGAVELAKITANPAGTNATRFAVVDVELGLQGIDDDGPIKIADLTTHLSADGKWGTLLVGQKGKIRSIILNVIRSKTIDQFESESISDVKDEIRRAINQQVFEKIEWPAVKFMGDDGEAEITVREVEFTGLIVQ